MPDLTSRLRGWIADLFAGAIVKKVVAGCVAALALAAGVAWTWIWHHFDPEFKYEAQPSSVPSHFVGMGQVLNQIEMDSRVYCTGGWDQRLAEFGLRTCYRFHFEPPGGYRLNVCMQDPKTIGVVTTDQLLALQYFERAFRPRDCFSAVPERGMNDYVVRIGKDAKVVNLQFANDASQPTAFCGCSDPEIRAIAVVMGAKLK